MKPRIEITTIDSNGRCYADLLDDNFETYDIYINDEKVVTQEQVRQLESENESLREFAKLAWGLLTLNEPQFVWESMLNDAHALGIMGRK